jgi:myo-inositol-1(or 4)-monophosphatase
MPFHRHYSCKLSNRQEKMNIQNLRDIGAKLFAAIGKKRIVPFSTAALRKCAGGDKSFPIDIEAENMVIDSLKALGEPLSIVSEELGTIDLNGGGSRVIIDPIDGSKNAISGVPFYCTAIAVAEGDDVASVTKGYVINLVTGDEFWAEKGKGAFFNGRRMSCQKDDVFYFVAYEAQMPGRDLPHLMPLLAGARKARCFGALALDLCYVAYGAFSVFAAIVPSRSFDYAAGYLMVKESGGVVTDITGKGIEHVKTGLQDRTSLLTAGNQKLHEAALKLLHG